MSRLILSWNHWPPLKRRAVVLIAVSVVAGFFLSRRDLHTLGAISALSAWPEFVSKTTPKFRVKMPSAPRHDVRDISITIVEIPIRKGIFTSDNGRGGIYTLAVGEYPDRLLFGDHHQWLIAEAKTAFPDSQDSSIEIIDTPSGGTVRVHRYDGGPETRGQFIIVGRYGYWLWYTAVPAEFSEASSRIFFESFRPIP